MIEFKKKVVWPMERLRFTRKKGGISYFIIFRIREE